MKNTNTPRVYRSLDLFSGCGGLSSGLSWARNKNASRIELAAAIDNWPAACDSFEVNLGLRPHVTGVNQFSVASAVASAGPFDVVVGGPPCQGFSTVGKRVLDDPRNQLVRAYLDAIELAAPSAFLMENVTGFTTFQNGGLMREVIANATALGYSCSAGIVLASFHGVPQRRRRFVLVGVRGANYTFPGGAIRSDQSSSELIDSLSSNLQVDEKPGQGVESWTFDEATGDLPPLNAGESSTEYARPPQNDLQQWFRERGGGLQLHSAVSHSKQFVEMMSYIPPGKSALDPEVFSKIPEAIRPTSGYPNSYARIRGDRPAPTITRNFTTPSSANCIHPHEDRALSMREGARCQSFPDWYEFRGTKDEQRLQIGNAVPPLLAKSLGESLLDALDSVSQQV